MAATKGVPRCVAALCAGAATRGAASNRRAERLCWAQNITKKDSSSSSSTSTSTSGWAVSSNAATTGVSQLRKTSKPWCRAAALHNSAGAVTGHCTRRGFRTSSSIRAAAAAAAATEKETSSGEKSDSGGYDYDLVTIGAGSGGVRASRIASQLGAKVAICELPYAAISSDTAGGVGGTCVLRGCVPKKILVFAAYYQHLFRESQKFGWSFDSPPKHDWPTLIENKNKELQRLLGVYKNILSSNNVELIEGRGKILDPNTVEIDGKVVKTKHILVSVGGRSTVPDLPGKEHVITSDDALDLPSRPNKICIVGGGYISLEFAGIFKGLGSEVHVFIRQDKVLRGFDEEIRDFLGQQMAMKGINFHFGESPKAIEKLGEGKFKLVTTKGEEIADTIMFATGRKPNTQNIGLEAVGVELDPKGAVIVDEYSRTSKENIWAVGDVTNRLNLTPVAIMEGTAFAKTAFGDQPTKPVHKAVPSAVFTDPPIGTVGLTEAQAVEQYGDVDVYTSSFRPMKAIISELGDKTFMKMIVDASTDKVLGVHMCGEEAPEIMQGFGVVVKAGMTKAQVDSTVGVHPSAAEELVTMRSPTRQIREKNKHSHHHGH